MKIRRRDFLKTAGVFGAGVVMYNPVLNAFTKSSGKGPVKAATGGWVSTTCQGCTTWCPVQIYVQNGRAVKVRGNVNSSINSGKVCQRGHLIPKQVYDPDRIKTPMKRTNSKKGKGVDPQFVPITWSEALNTIAAKIMELRNNNETHKYLLMRGRYTYSRDLIYSAMTKIIGSPNGISHSAICADAEEASADYTEGKWGYRDYDLANTKYLVLWSVDPFRSNRLLPSTMDKWGTIKDNATVVTIDPVLTAAAAKSDEWLAIKPGEDGALASAIAHHILVKGLWYKTFVGDFNGTGVSSFVANTTINESDFTEVETKGLIKWWNVELKDKTPSWAASKTGISQSKIEQIAENMAAVAPNIAVWFGPGICMSPRGVYAGMAVNALNGLLGGIDNSGGSIPKVSVSSMVNKYVSPSSYEDAIASAGLAYSKIDQRGTETFPAIEHRHPGKAVVTNNTASAMIAANPYEIKVAIGYRNNWAFSCANPKRWHDAFGDNNPNGAPFFAHITTHASEMSQFADIVLPAKMNGVETWSYLKTAGNLYGEASLQQPVISSLFDVKGDENEIPYLIAKELNDNHGFTNLYDYYHDEYPDPETSAAPTNEEEFAEYATKYFLKPAYDTLGGWSQMKSKGVYTKGPYVLKSRWGGNFGTVSGYFEFYSEGLKEALEEHATNHSKTVDEIMAVCNYEARGDLAFMPHYESPKRWGSKTDYPYDFVDIKSKFNREGRSQNLPWYYQFKKLDPGDTNWKDTIRINPSDAATLGISDGDVVKITSPTGYLYSTAKLWEGIRPGTVGKTYGYGHWAYGRFASDYAKLEEKPYNGNNNEILPEDYERISGSTARNGGFVGVKIEKV